MTTLSAHTQGLARIANETDEPVTTETRGRVFLSDVLILADRIAERTNIGMGETLDHARKLSTAIDRGIETTRQRYLTGDLLSLSPEEMTSRVRAATHDALLEQAGGLSLSVRELFEGSLLPEVTAALVSHCDDVVASMREEFDAHAKVIAQAHAAGLSAGTETGQLLENGAPKAITAYRALGAAVAGLNSIAALRREMTTTLGYGPDSPPVAAFVTDVPDNHAMQAAWNQWAGQTEVVQRNLPVLGSHLQEVKVRRLGGAWLALVHGGHALRLNTAAETQAVIGTARAGKVA